MIREVRCKQKECGSRLLKPVSEPALCWPNSPSFTPANLRSLGSLSFDREDALILSHPASSFTVLKLVTQLQYATSVSNLLPLDLPNY